MVFGLFWWCRFGRVGMMWACVGWSVCRSIASGAKVMRLVVVELCKSVVVEKFHFVEVRG